MADLVSVIVPAYNVERFIGRCLQSILAQSYRDLEVIVVDDGSTDATRSVCEALALQDSRLRVIAKRNGGLSSARNAGLDVARGSYIALVDGDDYLDRLFLETLHAAAQESQADMVVSGLRYVDGQENAIVELSILQGVYNEVEFWHAQLDWGEHDFDNVCYIVAPAKLYRAHVFEGERYDLGRFHEDEYIIHRLVARCERIAAIPYCGYNYVQHEESIMHGEADPARLLDAAEAFEKRAVYLHAKGMELPAARSAQLAAEKLCLTKASQYEGEDRSRWYSCATMMRRLVRELDYSHEPFSTRIKVGLYRLSPRLCGAAIRALGS